MLAVAIGGAVGALSRWGITVVLPQPSLSPEALTTVPYGLGLTGDFWAISIINLLGSFLLGLLHSRLERPRRRMPSWLGVGLGTGAIGAFTTLSSVALAWAVGSFVLTSTAPPAESPVWVAVVAGGTGFVVLAGSAVICTAMAVWGLLLGRGNRS